MKGRTHDNARYFAAAGRAWQRDGDHRVVGPTLGGQQAGRPPHVRHRRLHVCRSAWRPLVRLSFCRTGYKASSGKRRRATMRGELKEELGAAIAAERAAWAAVKDR